MPAHNLLRLLWFRARSESPSSAAICKRIWIGSLGDRELMAHDIGAGRALFRRR
jgi:hypothetical protein